MESVITFISVLAALLGIVAFWKQYVSEPEATKQYLIEILQTAQRRNAQLLYELKDYASINNAYNDHFMQGFSFNDSILLLERTNCDLFSEENIKTIKKSNGKGHNIEELIKLIKTHDLYIIQSSGYFHTHFQSHKDTASKAID